MTRGFSFLVACLAAACTREPAAAGPLVVPVGSSSSTAVGSLSATAPVEESPKEEVPKGDGFVVEGQHVAKVTHEAAMEKIRNSPMRAVARAYLSTADCSSVGAHHLVFTLETTSDGATGKRAYLKSGGLMGFPFPVGHRDGDAGITFAGGMADGWFVVGLDPKGGREPLRAPCVTGQWYDATVTALVPVTDAAEGQRLFRGGKR